MVVEFNFLMKIMLEPKTGFQEVLLSETEAKAIAQMERVLREESSGLKLVSGNGEEAIVPEVVSHKLRQVVLAIASGQPLTLFPSNCKLTLHQAANILNVSPTFLIELLEGGEISYIERDGDRLIRFEDLMIYKEKREKTRGQLLDKLIDLSQEAGFYEK